MVFVMPDHKEVMISRRIDGLYSRDLRRCFLNITQDLLVQTHGYVLSNEEKGNLFARLMNELQKHCKVTEEYHYND